MKQVRVEEAVGMVLCHDITRIVPGEFKGRAFHKGQRIQAEDIPLLKDLGKEHLYVYELKEGWIHEDDAARRIAMAAAGPGITLSDPAEGRVNLSASGPGLLKVDVEALLRINSVDEIVFSTLHTNQQVNAGRVVAGTRIIPLVTREANIAEVEKICRESAPVVSVRSFRPLQVGIVTTGSEVYSGRIEDKFGPVLKTKFAELGSCVMGQVLVADDVEKTVAAIHGFLDKGAGLVAVTGGMSVDPDDQTPAAIRAAGGEVVTYGAPTFPGAMFMLAYVKGVPVVGLPGCVM
ncbi:MAG: molybdopterin-binding protein, partial [Deltaproteobacteria bacterium]|nr:molybdopterin-binding protein [Deltaproteobacteria bacterium]